MLPFAPRPPLRWRPSSVISTVRRLLQGSLRACFIPQPSPGPCLVQGLVHFVQHSAFIRLSTPLPFDPRALTCKQAATHRHLDSDVLLHTKPLAIGLVFSRASGCSPLRVFCSPRFILRQRRQLPADERSCRFLGRLSSSLQGGTLRVASARLQRLSNKGLGCSVARASDLPELFGPSFN